MKRTRKAEEEEEEEEENATRPRLSKENIVK